MMVNTGHSEKVWVVVFECPIFDPDLSRYELLNSRFELLNCPVCIYKVDWTGHCFLTIQYTYEHYNNTFLFLHI